jgi:para-nitrobenzyl esterase
LSEDCLYLNVWTGAASATERRPVMVYFFGGAFTEGAGSVPLYDGTALAKKGAVVVTMNYRLGAFGWFVHPELSKESGRNASGNYGLMDMIASLQWVKSNISAFGGDPNNVTVFGQSAGANAIVALIASPEARGLFHRAIAQSIMGLGLGPMPALADAEARGAEAAAKAGASSLVALRAMSAEDVQKNLRGGGMIIDGWIIPRHVIDTFRAGEQNPVDVMFGSNKDEGSFFPGGPGAQAFQNQVKGRWGELADAYLKLYPAGTDAEAAASSSAAFRDETFWRTRLYVGYQAEQGRKAYQYYFTQSPPMPDGQASLGATHAAELPYVFNNLGQLPLFPDRSSAEKARASVPDQTLAERMSSYWVNFARSGDPNAEGLPEWPTFKDKQSGTALVLAEPASASLPEAERIELYDILFEKQLAAQ